MVHYIETAKEMKEERKDRLARFMVKLSGGYSILPFPAVREAEVNQAILRQLGRTPTMNIKDLVVKKGIDHALGAEFDLAKVSEKFQNNVSDLLGNEDTLVKILTDPTLLRTSREMGKDDMEIVEKLEEDRRKLLAQCPDKEMRLRIAIAQMAEGSIMPIVVTELKRLGLPVQELAQTFETPEAAKAFILGMPTMDFWINLHIERDNDIGRKIDRNDTNDIAFLSMAVPYCDVVVTEKFWAHKLRSKGFDAKYNCEILTSVSDLPRTIKDRIGD